MPLLLWFRVFFSPSLISWKYTWSFCLWPHFLMLKCRVNLTETYISRFSNQKRCEWELKDFVNVSVFVIGESRPCLLCVWVLYPTDLNIMKVHKVSFFMTRFSNCGTLGSFSNWRIAFSSSFPLCLSVHFPTEPDIIEAHIVTLFMTRFSNTEW